MAVAEARRRTRRALAAVAACLAIALAAAPSALASHPEGLPNWPVLLPPGPPESGRLQLAFDRCHGGRYGCPAEVIAEMYRRWRPLDRKCDHRAVFALTYLRTTEEFARTLKRVDDFFDGGRWVNHEDAVFAELYFRAYDRWEKGKSVPAAWRIAFEAAESPNLTGIGDLLLGMNAHINRDLPYTLAHVGLRRKGSGESRKPDHDKVNEFLERVADPLQEELARRYDPMFETTDGGPSPLDELGTLQVVRDWRENAWRNAERLIAAKDDPAELELVRQSIEHQAEAEAEAIVAGNTMPGYGATRDAHCRRDETPERSKRRGSRRDPDEAPAEPEPPGLPVEGIEGVVAP